MNINIEEMVKVGMHFGHQAKKWNPKMAPYIYGTRGRIHIIDLIQTYFHLKQVSEFITQAASKNKKFLFVGTKKQASRLIAKVAVQSDSFFVNQRWLGGMLTNWKTIKSSIKKLNELELQENNGEFNNLPKKEAAFCKKEKERLHKYLGGLKKMTVIPDVVIIIGQTEEINAVRECVKLGIRSITILDTDCDPTLADLFVPANDDSVASIQLLLTYFLQAIKTGQGIYKKEQELLKNQKNKSKNWDNRFSKNKRFSRNTRQSFTTKNDKTSTFFAEKTIAKK
jgi:small subunit ribosomal protein S2